jgi:hypothetical protein
VAPVRPYHSEERIASIIKEERISEIQLLVTANVLPGWLVLSTLIMEAILSSETSVLTRATRPQLLLRFACLFVVYIEVASSSVAGECEDWTECTCPVGPQTAVGTPVLHPGPTAFYLISHCSASLPPAAHLRLGAARSAGYFHSLWNVRCRRLC